MLLPSWTKSTSSCRRFQERTFSPADFWEDWSAMSTRTILKSPRISRGSTNQDISFFPDNPYCLHHRLQKDTPTVLTAGTITNRLSIRSTSGVLRPAEVGSKAQCASESTIRLFAYGGLRRCTAHLGALRRVGEKQPAFGTAAGYTPVIFVSALTVAVATGYLTWPRLARGCTGSTNPPFIPFPSEEDLEA